MSSLGLSADLPPPPPPPQEDDAAHPPPRSFSQPQFPYHFSPRTAPPSAAPSLREPAVVRLSGRPSTAHAPGTAHLGPGAFAPMSASARTSYTRVDQTAPGTPTPELAELSPSRYALEVDADTHEAEAEAEAEAHAEVDDPEKAHGEQAVPQMPQVALTFLTITGKRRTMSFDPDTTIGRWQDERPPAPSYLRILYLGKILQDEDTLAKWAFPITQPDPAAPPTLGQATVVHLSVRAAPLPAEDTPKKRRGTGMSDGEEGGCGCCGCVVC
ncbi:uncharacterized protein B0H18DRAFT_982437 [Fomitopsis serialis]|uniref:uncharacterized protein n=1 Tax=Fomitopsis serialis TaxID=139415 RepID=UPI002007C8CB|nr:uncharacterized protein B0H18DRAFT_982437 [Neoantrodia serialis]KAH9933876.1 hypothetical protein B0H18DRAFT_982437 [Neoantrodia serialis]